ncbi:hypothetical protein B0H14DRAFT_2641154 [Mycena olivaceomarginata]|nr:hypothetical protein B0H14DRAFT_2641154 [Mycena olivaceomarginata]
MIYDQSARSTKNEGRTPPINPGERVDKTEAVACRDVDRPPSNRSAALDVARKGGIAPPTALGAAHKGGILYTYGPLIDSGSEWADKTEAVASADKTEAVACRDVDGSPSNRSAALDVAHKGGIAPPTAALGAARKSGVLYAYEPPITYGPPIDSDGERADKTEAVAGRDVDGPPSRTASYTYGPSIDSGGMSGADKTEAVAGRNVNRDPINRSAALDVARKEGIAPPTTALDAARRSGVWYTHGPPIDSGGDERADKTEAVAGRNVNRPPINRSAALDVARKGGIAPPTAALDAACRSGVWYTHEPPIDSGGRNVNRPPINRSAALDVAREEGIAPPTAALGAARKSGVSYAYEPPITYGPSIDSGGMSGRTRQKWWQGGIAPPTAALDAARKNGIRICRSHVCSSGMQGHCLLYWLCAGSPSESPPQSSAVTSGCHGFLFHTMNLDKLEEFKCIQLLRLVTPTKFNLATKTNPSERLLGVPSTSLPSCPPAHRPDN